MIGEEKRREREERIEDELHLEYIKMYKQLLHEKEFGSENRKTERKQKQRDGQGKLQVHKNKLRTSRERT